MEWNWTELNFMQLATNCFGLRGHFLVQTAMNKLEIKSQAQEDMPIFLKVHLGCSKRFYDEKKISCASRRWV